MNGWCLGVAGSSAVVEAHCDAAREQVWDLRVAPRRSVLQSRSTHKCLDVPGGSATHRGEPVAWRCNGGVNQVWRVSR